MRSNKFCSEWQDNTARHYETEYFSIRVDDNTETEYNFVIVKNYALGGKDYCISEKTRYNVNE